MPLSTQKRRALSRNWLAGAFAALVLTGTFGIAAFAQQQSAPQQQPPPAAPSQPPSAEALALARQLVISSGISRSFQGFIPRILAGLEQNLTRTRPEIADDLHAVLIQIEPEFLPRENEVIDDAAKIIAHEMTEAELKEAVAFFTSASGKKYVAAQPAILGSLVIVLKDWQQRVGTDILARARAEMKKKGKDI